MEANKFGFSWRTLTNEPVRSGDTSIVTEAQALSVRWPGGGWVWNRPTAVYIYRDNDSRRVPIVDATRLALIALSLAAGLTILILQALTQTKQETPDE